MKFSTLLNLSLLLAFASIVLGWIINDRMQQARVNDCNRNLKLIRLALEEYYRATGAYPPLSIKDASGTPIHSWRVLILPYIGDEGIYAEYRLDEPYDGPNNRKLKTRMPELYRCPSEAAGSNTSYLRVRDEKGEWSPSLGGKNLCILEMAGSGVNWMEPTDLDFQQARKLLFSEPSDTKLNHKGGMNSDVGFDGIEFIRIPLEEGEIWRRPFFK